MLNQTFGIEIEMAYIKRETAANLIAEYFGTGSGRYIGAGYSTYIAADRQGRIWKCSRDSSIMCHDDDAKCELITPILTYSDMADLQEIVRLMRHNGAKTGATYGCGIHVHIGALDYTVKEIRNLVNFMSANQDIIYKALDVDYRRECHYCRKIETSLVNSFNDKKRTKDTDEAAMKWYRVDSKDRVEYHKSHHYDDSRYHGLNLHSLFSKGTVEFRLFNGTLHAGLIRSYIVLCLAICNFCKTKKSLKPCKERKFNDKYTMYALLCEIGVKGDEFKNCRDHLVKNLAGGLGHEARYMA